MKYDRVIQGTFIDRPNRFIANVRIEGEGDVPDPVVRCHVKNTGRCLELLVPGAKVVLSISDDPKRKTGYDLIAVYKGDLLINMDSQAPNAVVKESFEKIVGKCGNVVPEYRYGDSRFDFYAERNGEKVFAEVKGVTLESDGLALFPDAPTERGLKHIRELTGLAGSSYRCWVIFLIQMSGVRGFSPNYAMQPELGRACEEAVAAGVNVVAYDCTVAEDSLWLGDEVPVILHS